LLESCSLIDFLLAGLDAPSRLRILLVTDDQDPYIIAILREPRPGATESAAPEVWGRFLECSLVLV